MTNRGEIIIYKEDGTGQLEVQLDNETVWLSLNQMASLFSKDKSVISRHIKNIYREKELPKTSTVAFFATVQKEGSRKVNREIEHFNLDMILSVGYRVNSKKGTQFRIWATNILKENLVKGFTVNTKRIEQREESIKELQNTLKLIQSNISKKQLSGDESSGLLNIITNYIRSFLLLNQYDSQTLETPLLTEKISFEITYEEADQAIAKLKKELIDKKEATNLFGQKKDEGFQSLLQSVIQTFEGKSFYPSIEEQAAHLLYFIIKNHPFIDGNKRIGAFLFVWFLQRNKHLLRKNGEAKINDNALVALALLVAESDPDHKDLIIRLIINLINNQ
jgi:death-on-curing family protein